MPPNEYLLVPCLRVLHQPAIYVDSSWLNQKRGCLSPRVLADAKLRLEENLLAGDPQGILEDDIGNLLVRNWFALPQLAAMLDTWLRRAEIVGRNLLHTLIPGHRALLHLPISPPALPPSALDPLREKLNTGSSNVGVNALVYCAHSVSPAFGQRVALALPKQTHPRNFAPRDIMKIRSALKFSVCYVAQN